MFRFFLILFFLIININNVLSNEVNIQFKINNKIITNVDIEKEYRYLAALNTNLKKLEKKKAYEIAKTSIIKEIIKKNELKKYYNLDLNPSYMTETVEKFYKALGIKNEKEFENYLLQHDLKLNDVRKN